MPSYVVTGASRGLGFEFIKQLSEDSSNVVFGLVRSVKSVQEKVAKSLPGRKNLHIIHGDLTDIASLESAAKYVSATTGGSLDMLIANAAVVTGSFACIDQDFTQDPVRFDEEMLNDFKVNVVGNIHLIHVFIPLIKNGDLKKVVAMSSGMGDADFVVEAGVKMQAPYAVSKAALNMAIAKYHVEYKDQGILFMSVSPGIVDTGGYDAFEKTPEIIKELEDMGAVMKAYSQDFTGPITPEESIKLVLGVVDRATIEKNGGRMISHLGTFRWL